MKELILLYWGTVLLMYLSQVYMPAWAQLNEGRLERSSTEPGRMDVFMLIIVGWMAAFMFLRTDYNDTIAYRIAFANAPSLEEFIATKGWFRLTGNHFSYMYQSAIRSMTENYHIFFFFPAVFSSFAFVRLMKNYSVNPALSLLIFFSMGTYVMYMAALKQCLAMFILLLSLPYLERRQYIRFVLTVLLAMTFHSYAIVFLVCPFLCGKPWGKRMWILLLLTLAALLTYRSTLGVLMSWAEQIGILVSEEELFDGQALSILRVAVYLVPAVLTLIFRKRLVADTSRMENLMVNLSCVSGFVLMLGLAEGANLFARMAAYFEVFTALSLPWMIRKIFDKWSATFVSVVCAVCFFGYFLYEFMISKAFGANYHAITLGQFIVELLT